VKLDGRHIICQSLVNEGVHTVFGHPGGAILDLYDVLPEFPIRHILVRHEQGAAFGADGYARATGDVGVCFATSGPGATNLVTGLANAYMDSSAVVAITGQVPTSLIGRDAFQEIDTTGITLPITKHNYLVKDVRDLPRIMKEAFHIARTGRRGPVLIDVAKDVFTAETEFEFHTKVHLPGYRPTGSGNMRQIRAAAAVINRAKRPVILAGQGVIASGAFDQLRELAEKAQIPIITTLLGIGSIRETHPLAFGMIGLHGLWHNNYAVTHSDVVIGLGMRFDDRVTRKLADFAPHAHVVHVDIDPAEISKNVLAHTPVVGDAKLVLTQLLPEVHEARHDDWVGQINEWKREHPLETPEPSVPMTQQWAIKELSDVTQGQASIVTDVGQHQMWAAQHYTYDRLNSWFTAGGLGAMGFGLPAAMGVAVARPEEQVWALLGDGGFMMTVQEMATIVEENIPVKIVIMNNSALGMIRQWQNMLYKSNYVAAHFHKNPDFVKLAEAFGMPAWRAKSPVDLASAYRAAAEHDGPCLIDVIVDEVPNVYPMVRAGAGIAEMDEADRTRVLVPTSAEEY